MNFRDFLGASLWLVLLRLAVLSIIAGMILSFFGVTPRNFFRVLDDFARSIYDMGFGALQWLLDYLIVGAMLVVPIWLVIRLLKARPRVDG